MIALELRFVGGRYHATPWNRHVNEGQVEWPPSPWRLSRALLATWHLKARDEIDEDTVRRILTTLSESRPHYRLPPATPTHTRHYMPIKGDKTTKVFDAFLRIDRDEALVVAWPEAELAPDDQAALGKLVRRLSYLGRAESWLEGRLAVERGGLNCAPEGQGELPGEHTEVLCPVGDGDYGLWRAAELDRLLSLSLEAKRRKDAAKGKDITKTRLSKKDQAKEEAKLPEDLFAALHADIGDLQKHGWSRAPGAQWVSYTRPAFGSRSRPAPSARGRQPTTARFAVVSKTPPQLTDAIRFGELVRSVAIRVADGRSEQARRWFAGKDEEGAPLRGHQHPMFLPESHSSQGRITHLTVHASKGFDEEALTVLDALTRRPIAGRESHEHKLVLIGLGAAAELAQGAEPVPLLARARVWQSRTPFVPTRHPKTRRGGAPKLDEYGVAIGSPVHDLLRLLSEMGHARPDVEAVPFTELGSKRVRWLSFNRRRQHRRKGARGDMQGYGFRLTFPEPIDGPLALGYGAHFGLGRFVPAGSGA